MTIKIQVTNAEDPGHTCSVKVWTRDRSEQESDPTVDVLREAATLKAGESCEVYVTNSRALVVEEESNG